VPVTTLLSGFVPIAVITAAPALTAVASPDAGSIVATDGLLDVHTAAGIVFPLTVAL
jgi:hypothetical protein